MQDFSHNNPNEVTCGFSDNIQPTYLTNYAELLHKFNLTYTSSEYYWLVGDLYNFQGWVLHLSAIKAQLQELFLIVLPVLIHKNIPFKIVQNITLAGRILDGQLGSEYLGKIMTIYPPNDAQAILLADQLIAITHSFMGPVITNDRWLGSIVYTKLESYAPVTKKQGNSLSDKAYPFKHLPNSEISKQRRLLNSKYYPITKIKKDAKGDVIKAIFFEKPWKVSYCIIKQGRRHMFSDNTKRDIRDRLRWQYELYTQLGPDLPLPKIFDHFSENGDTYLAMQYIKGLSFTNHLSKLYDNRIWHDLPSAVQ